MSPARESAPLSDAGEYFSDVPSHAFLLLVPLHLLRDLGEAEGVNYSRFFESREMVTGPSLTKATCIMAPNDPRPTGPESWAERAWQNDS